MMNFTEVNFNYFKGRNFRERNIRDFAIFAKFTKIYSSLRSKFHDSRMFIPKINIILNIFQNKFKKKFLLLAFPNKKNFSISHSRKFIPAKNSKTAIRESLFQNFAIFHNRETFFRESFFL